MAQDTFQFNRKFRLKLLSLMLDNNWMAKFGDDIILPEYFDMEDEEAIARAIRDYRDTYHKSPRDAADLLTFTDGEYEDTIDTILDGHYEWDLSLAADQAIQFSKEQAVKLAILEGVEDINKGDLRTPVERMKAALTVGDTITSPGIDPIRDTEKWLYDAWSDKVPTMLTHLDRVLEGGLAPGELGVILGPPNQGKSMGLVNIGYGAASLLGRRNVVHFVHEMSTTVTAKRYAARMLFKFPRKNDNLKEYEDELLIAARRLMPGKIRIIGGAEKMTTAQIEGHLNRLVAEGFEPGLIIDDYPDLVEPPRHYSDRRFELSGLFQWFRELGAKYNCPVWGASQANRASLSKEIITMQDIAEDIGKANIADVIVALCQTWEESQIDACRLFMAKVRDGRAKDIISAKYYGKSQAIISTGFVKYKEGKGKDV